MSCYLSYHTCDNSASDQSASELCSLRSLIVGPYAVGFLSLIEHLILTQDQGQNYQVVPNMPVATSTMIQNKISPNSGSVSSLKYPANKTVSSSIDPGLPSKDSSSKHKRALEKIYNRAARAFLNRNVLLTQELLETGFRSLESLALTVSVLRKWDILRITFDTMMYFSPPATSNQYSNNLLSNSPHSFVNNMYNRSVQLFQRTEDITILPSQVLSTLVYSSLKIDAPDIGRRMIEDWLAGRGNTTEMSLSWMSSSSASSSVLDGYDADASVNGDSPMEGPDPIERGDGYPKILELYCLQVLPRLEQWEYAADFLEYESELDVDTRDVSLFWPIKLVQGLILGL